MHGGWSCQAPSSRAVGGSKKRTARLLLISLSVWGAWRSDIAAPLALRVGRPGDHCERSKRSNHWVDAWVLEGTEGRSGYWDMAAGIFQIRSVFCVHGG